MKNRASLTSLLLLCSMLFSTSQVLADNLSSCLSPGSHDMGFECQCTSLGYQRAAPIIQDMMAWSHGAKVGNLPTRTAVAYEWNAAKWADNVVTLGRQFDELARKNDPKYAGYDWQSAVSDSPEVGDIVTWASPQHVAVVTKYDPDSSSIDIEERNYKAPYDGTDPTISSRSNVSISGAKFIRAPRKTEFNTGGQEVQQSVPVQFDNTWVFRNVRVESASKFELWIDNQIVMRGDRPSSRRSFVQNHVWFLPKRHSGEVRWWKIGDEQPPTFWQTWWPKDVWSLSNFVVVAAERDPDSNTSLGVAYTYTYTPSNPVQGNIISFSVAATPQDDVPIDRIQVIAGGRVIGSISGSRGSIQWQTSPSDVGTKQVLLQALVGDWPGPITPRTFTLAIASDNQPSSAQPQTAAVPDVPPLQSPINRANMMQGADVTLSWSSSVNAAQYKVELWGGPYNMMTPCNWQSGTSCHIGQMRLGTMSWHVKARNSVGTESDWSATWEFTIAESQAPQQTITLLRPTAASASPVARPPTSTPPSATIRPTLSNPGNGSSMPQSTDVTLSWNVSTNATQYKVELWGGPYNLMTPCDWQSGTSCHIGQMWPGTMSWHVKARNTSGQETNWSDTWIFTIQSSSAVPPTPAPTSAPTQPLPPVVNRPTLSNPGNGSSLPQSTDVTLSWNVSTNATQYKVEVWGGPYSLMTPCDWQTVTACHIGQMWPGTMSWHIKARNGAGQESNWSDTWTFTIQQIPPTQPPPPPSLSKPSLSSPGNGATMPQSTSVVLGWNGSSNATQYKVELWGGPYSLMTPCNWQSGTSCNIGQMWPGTMSWHVKARNSNGLESDWSDTWSFTIQQIPPTQPPPPPSTNKPGLSSPSNGASLPKSTDVTLRWNGLSGASQYKVELWGGPYSLMTPCNWQGGTSCHIGQMWPGNMSWHVKARLSNGQETDWSDTWNFTIQN